MAKETRTPQLSQRGAAFVTSGCILLVAGLLMGQHDLTRIGVLLLALLGTCLGLARWRPTRFSVERSVSPARVSVDDSASISAVLHNDSTRSSAFALAEEELDLTLGDRPRFVLPPTAGHADRTIDYAVRPQRRGLHQLGPLRVWVRDPFGLTSVPRASTGVGSLLVAPRIHPLGAERALARGIGPDGAVPHQVALHGEDDQSIREYREGDDLRRIHWPATARTGALMVRQEDRPARRRAVLLLDARRSAHPSDSRRSLGPSAAFEWSVTMAASVAAHLSDQGYAVHLLTPDAERDAGVRRDDEIDGILDALARVQLTGDEGLAATLHAAYPLTAGGGLLVAFVAGLAESDARALAMLRPAGSTGIAFVHGVGPGASSATTAQLLQTAGWRTLTVTPHLTPARAWTDATSAAALVRASSGGPLRPRTPEATIRR